MYARITKDHLDLSSVLPDWRPLDGLVVVDGEHDEAKLFKVRLLDDDRELYYEAKVDGDEAAEQLLEWAMRDAGATILQRLANDVSQGYVWTDYLN